MASTAWQRLGDHLRKAAARIDPIGALLGSELACRWRATWHGEQLTLLASELHARQSSEAYADLLADARSEWSVSADANGRDGHGRNLDLLEEDLRRQQALDPALVASLATAKADGYARWQVARRRSDFSLFSGALQTLIDLRREQARQLAGLAPVGERWLNPLNPICALTGFGSCLHPCVSDSRR